MQNSLVFEIVNCTQTGNKTELVANYRMAACFQCHCTK